jgi:small subunit ribosomal protein S17
MHQYERKEDESVERNYRKTRIGKVVSNKMDKTIVVALEESKAHPLYNKVMKTTYKLKAHDENNEANVGDKVMVMETRPLSRDKRWRLVEIVEKAR